MIVRYVFVKLNPEQHSEREQIIQSARECIPKVKGVTGLTIMVPADGTSAAAWDLALCVEFKRIEDVEPYRVDPAHRRFVDEVLTPRAAALKAWNFSSEDRA